MIFFWDRDENINFSIVIHFRISDSVSIDHLLYVVDDDTMNSLRTEEGDGISWLYFWYLKSLINDDDDYFDSLSTSWMKFLGAIQVQWTRKKIKGYFEINCRQTILLTRFVYWDVKIIYTYFISEYHDLSVSILKYSIFEIRSYVRDFESRKSQYEKDSY